MGQRAVQLQGSGSWRARLRLEQALLCPWTLSPGAKGASSLEGSQAVQEAAQQQQPRCSLPWAALAAAAAAP
jgi:hypothetical protein